MEEYIEDLKRIKEAYEESKSNPNKEVTKYYYRVYLIKLLQSKASLAEFNQWLSEDSIIMRKYGNAELNTESINHLKKVLRKYTIKDLLF